MNTRSTQQRNGGLVGLGDPGSALARPLSASFHLHVYDVNPSQRDRIQDLPLTWCESVADLADAVEVVLLSLPHPEVSRSVVDTIVESASAPELVIETSTITPVVARELGQRCRARGIGFVDAAIAGGVQLMAAGRNTFLAGGSEADLAAAKQVLEPIASEIHVLGPVGAGSGAKVVNNAVMHALMVVLVEAAAMSKKLDIPMHKLVEILARPDGIMRPLEHRLRDRVSSGSYDGGMSVSNARKDSMLALETAQQLGVPLFAISASHTPYEIAQSLGFADQDYASLARLWESWSGVKFDAEE